MSQGTNLGSCGAFLTDRRCRGRVVAIEEVGSLIEGRCEECGTPAATPALKANPLVAHQRRIDRADIPRKFFGKQFERTDDNAAALQAARDWVDGFDASPLPAPALWGRAGRGKSHLLSAVCVKLIRDRHVNVWFRSTRGLLRDLQDFDGNADQTWQRATTVKVLALDDLGAERGTEWRGDQLADLIDARYEAELPIVFATNYPPTAWGEVIDERTASRLRGMSFPIEVSGPDRRGEGEAA